MTQAVLAQGWTVTWGSHSLDEATSFDVPKVTSRVDVTNHDTDAGFREFIAGLFDPIEITFTCNHVPSHAVFESAAGDSTTTAILTMTSPMGASYSGTAWVSGFTVHAPATGEAETIDIVFTINGELTFSS